MIEKLIEIYKKLRERKKKEFNRVLSYGDYIVDRWEKAKYLGFGEQSSIYDSAMVYGDVKVGKNTWIGPFVILDGTGQLEIGNFCSISSSVHIYSHDTVAWATSGGKDSYEYGKVIIGDNCYIGPHTVISKGIELGDGCIVGANSFVNKSFPAHSKIAGNPAKEILYDL